MTTANQSKILATVQQDLLDACDDARQQRAKTKADYLAFELRLEATGIPKGEWHPQLLHRSIILKREWDHAIKNLLRVARDLKAFETPASAAAKTETRPPAKPSTYYEGVYIQSVDVRVVDGKTVSRFNYGPHHWIKVDAWHMVSSFRRHYRFVDKHVPPEYAFVLEHEGSRYAPTEILYIEYDSDEFKRICHREVETNSEHGLDGKRLAYWRRYDKEPLGIVDDQ